MSIDNLRLRDMVAYTVQSHRMGLLPRKILPRKPSNNSDTQREPDHRSSTVALMHTQRLPTAAKRAVCANILPVRGKALQVLANLLGDRQTLASARPGRTHRLVSQENRCHVILIRRLTKSIPYAPPILCIPRFFRAAALTEAQLDGVEKSGLNS